MVKWTMVRTLLLPKTLFTLLLLFSLASPAWGRTEPAPDSLIDQVGAVLAQQIKRADWPPDLRRFYRDRDHRPLWINVDGIRPEVDLLISTLIQSHSQGLQADQYNYSTIYQYRTATRAADLARLELLLTDAFQRYCRDARSGRAHLLETDPKWHIETEHFDPLKALAEGLQRGTLADLLNRLHPTDPRYMRLRTALAKHRQIASKGGWPEIITHRTLELGLEHHAIPKLRIRLALTDDLQSPLTVSTIFDSPLEQAVRRFQQRHGLEVDGRVGPRTLEALNVPVETRIAQIVLNMERWRWGPLEFEPRHILVNMAAFELEAYESNRSALSMKVIVGRRYHSTPAFTEELSHLVLNPYWNIPTKLAVRDFLPKLRRDPAALKKRGIRVFSEWSDRAVELDPAEVDWHAVDPDNFRYWLRQDPGPRNALGRIKFLMPNRFAIYLHDTPQRQLFQRNVRTFSSGCIRLENPLALARYLLEGQDDWTGEALAQAIDRGRQQTITLTRKIPVYLVYWTAWVDATGTMQFRDDVYRRDKGLHLALVQP